MLVGELFVYIWIVVSPHFEKVVEVENKVGWIKMNEVVMLHGAEPRNLLQAVIEKKVPAVMSYLSRGKWHTTKVLLTSLGGNTFCVGLSPRKKPHPINIQIDQPVGMSLKYEYGKFVFETRVVSLEPSPDSTGGGEVALVLPGRIEVIQRRSYFRVDIPKSLKVDVAIWHRGYKAGDDSQLDEQCWQGRLVDISAGGAQVVFSAGHRAKFKKGQFVMVRFTPLPYEMPLMFSSQIRNILPTSDGNYICLGLQIVGLEASSEGRKTLRRLCRVVEKYYQINHSNIKQQEMQPADY